MDVIDFYKNRKWNSAKLSLQASKVCYFYKYNNEEYKSFEIDLLYKYNNVFVSYDANVWVTLHPRSIFAFQCASRVYSVRNLRHTSGHVIQDLVESL